jgi:hypothetical protein
MQYLTEGWTCSPVIGLEEHWHAGVRRVDIYHFELFKDEQVQMLPVQSNPIVRRLIEQRQLKIVLLRRNDVRMPNV